MANNNLEIIQAVQLRFKAHYLIGYTNLSSELKTALKKAVDGVRLNLCDYYNKSGDEIKKAFVNKVLTGLGEEVDSSKRERLRKWLLGKI